MSLPNETMLFCGKEYTVKNLKFAKQIEPDNSMIDHKAKHAEAIRANGDFTVGSKLMEEHLYNPFIRCTKEDFIKTIADEQDPFRVFAKIRKLKD